MDEIKLSRTRTECEENADRNDLLKSDYKARYD